jgi:hypothetical protein
MVAAAKTKKAKKSPELKRAPKPARTLAPIETLEAAKTAPRYVLLPLSGIEVDAEPNRLQAPTAETVEDLARSMAQVGLKQPIGVTLHGAQVGCHRLVWGRRRLEAARRLGWTEIQAVLVDAKSDQDVLILRGIENMQREATTPVDEALVVARVIDVFEAQAALGPTVEPPEGEQPNLPLPIAQQVEARRVAVRKAAEWFGKPEAWIRDRMYLSRFGPDERYLVASGRLPLLHAREIAKLADPEARASVARSAAARNPENHATWEREYPMELRELRAIVSSNLLSLVQVPWQLDAAFGGKPACVECPHNSANNPGLFDGGARFAATPADALSRHGDRQTKEPKAGVCTNRACYAIKSGLAKRAVRTTANRAAKAIKELPKKERPAKLTAGGLSALVDVPDFIDRAQVVTAAEELKKAKPAAAGGGSGGKVQVDAGTAARRKDEEQRREAGYKLGAAQREWAKKAEPLLARELMKTPGAWTLYKIFREHPAVRKLEGHNVKGEKVMAAPEFRQALQLLTSAPSLEVFAALEKGCGRKFGLLDEWRDVESGLAMKLMEAYGIEVDAPPTLEDFLPKPKADAGGEGAAP